MPTILAPFIDVLRRVAPRRLLLGGLSALLVLYACTDAANDLASPVGGHGARLRFAPEYSYLGGNYFGEPINRIRLTARNEATGAVIGTQTFDVDPNNQNWSLVFDVVVPDASPVSVLVTVELINVGEGGVEQVEWSGVTAPINVTPGQNAPPPAQPVTLYQGPPANLTVTAVTITPATAEITEGGALTLAAAIAGGAPGASAAWSSLDDAIATVDQAGVVTGQRDGSARIVAVAGPRSDTAVITVRQRVGAIVLEPDTQRVNSIGDEVTFTARVLDPRGTEITGSAITWSSADAGVAEHVADGRFRTRANGTARITATSVAAPAISAGAVLIVDQQPNQVAIAPLDPTLDALGATLSFTATISDAQGTPLSLPVTWRSSRPVVAGIDAAGIATAHAVGTTEITAIVAAGTPDSMVATTTLTVSQTVSDVMLLPLTDTLFVSDTLRFSALARDANQQPIDDAAIAWSVSDTTVAVINARGLVTARAAGTVTVTATSGTKSATASLIVRSRGPARVVIEGAPLRINAIGFTRQLTATVFDAEDAVLDASVTWLSLDPAIASVNANGLVTALQNGSARITASVNPADTVTVEVEQVVASLEIAPSAAALGIGDTIRLGAIARDSNHVDVATTASWSSSNTAVATVDASGLVTAVAEGSAEITAAAVGHEAVATIGVNAANLVVELRSSASDELNQGAAVDVTLVVRNTGAAPAGATTAVLRVIDAATAQPFGIDELVLPVPFIAGGDSIVQSLPALQLDTLHDWPDAIVVAATIDAANDVAESREDDNAFASAPINIRFAVRSVTASEASIGFGAVGATQQLTAVVHGHFDRVLDRPVTWRSDDAEIASVDANGVVTAHANGETLIVVAADGREDTVAVTVHQVIHTLTVTPAAAALGIGDTVRLQAVAQDSGGVDVATTITWSSSNTAVATVDASGVVTAVAEGSAEITAAAAGHEAVATIGVNAANLVVELRTSVSGVIAQGDTVGITVVTRNIGGAAAGAAEVGLQIIDAETGEQFGTAGRLPFAAIPAGDSIVVHAPALRLDTLRNWPDAIALRVFVDSANTVAESNEQDNIFVTEPVAIDFAVRSVTASEASIGFAAIGATQQLTAVVHGHFDRVLDRPVTWRSDDAGIASVDANGVVTAHANGETLIVVEAEGREDTVTVTVNEAVASIEITSDSIWFRTIGRTSTVAVIVRDGLNQPVADPAISWHALDESVAAVNGEGVVTAVGNGLTDIVATSGAHSATLRVRVQQVAHLITITPNPADVQAGGTVQLTAVAADSNSNALANAEFAWSSTNTAIATVDAATGLVTGVALGTASVTATHGASGGSTVVNVVAGPPASIAPAGDTLRVSVVAQSAGDSLAIEVTDAEGNPVDDIPISWTANNGELQASYSFDESAATNVAMSMPPTAVVTRTRNGVSKVSWTLPTTAGAYNVVACVENTSICTTFRGVAKPDRPHRANKRADVDSQVVTVARIAANAFELTVTDQFDNPTPDALVEWTVDGGTVSNAATTTDANGKAIVQWTAPTTRGLYFIDFTVKDGASVVATGQFKAHAKPDRPTRHNKKDGTDDQLVTVFQTAANALELTVSDSFGNVVDDAVVEWSLRAPLNDAALSETVTPVNAEGVAGVSWTVGKKSGNVFVDYVVKQDNVVYASGFFKATAKPDRPRGGVKKKGDEQLATVGTVAGDSLILEVTDQFGNAVPDAMVQWQSANGVLSAASSMTDAAGATMVRYTLGTVKGQKTVDANVLDGETVVATETFRVTGKADHPANANKTKGGGLSAVVSPTLTDELEVQILDQYGNGVDGAEVVFSVQGGNGKIAGQDAVSVVTDADGFATVQWTLGTKAGAHKTRVSVNGFPIQVDFDNTANPDRPRGGVKKKGDEQLATVGTVAGDSLILEVTDQYGNVVPSAVVQWQSTSGVLSAASTVTDAAGVTMVRYTLGTVKGQKIVDANVLDGETVVATETFRLNGKADNPAAINKNRGGGLTAQVSPTLGEDLEVTIVDQYGNGVDGAEVVFSVQGGNGNIGGQPSEAVITDADGKAIVHWTMGTKAGAHKTRVTVNGFPVQIDFDNTANPGPLHRIKFNQAAFNFDALADETAVTTSGEDQYQNAVVVIPALSSKDATKASFSEGKVRSHGNGSTFIVATSGDVRDSVPVTISQRIKFLQLNADTLTALQINKKLVRIQRDRNNQTIDSAFHEPLLWHSSIPEVATVDPNTGVVTSVANGFSTITATAISDNTVLASVVVEVRQAASLEGISLTGLDSLAIPTTVYVGDTIYIMAHARDSNNRPVQRWSWSAAPAGPVTFGGTLQQQRGSTIEIIGTEPGVVTITATDAKGVRNQSTQVVVSIPPSVDQ